LPGFSSSTPPAQQQAQQCIKRVVQAGQLQGSMRQMDDKRARHRTTLQAASLGQAGSLPVR